MILICILILTVFSHSNEKRFKIPKQVRCNHDQIMTKLKESGLVQDRRNMKSSSLPYSNHPMDYEWDPNDLSKRREIETLYEPLRVFIDTSDIDADSSLSNAKKTFLKTKVVPLAKSKIESLLKVIRVQGNFYIPRENDTDMEWCQSQWGNGKCKITYPPERCGYVNPSKSYFNPVTICPVTNSSCSIEGGGVANTDTLIFMSARHNGSCIPDPPETESSTLAFARHCLQDQYKRPIVGFANWCPDRIEPITNEWVIMKKYVYVLVHEIWHALGLSKDLYNDYRYHNGTVREAHQLKVTMVERENNVEKFVTEKMLSVARKHFNCPSLNGVEIEDGGGGGTAKSHPEQRLFLHDFMSGVRPSHPVFSDISVAFLEDSGWYMGNYDNTETLWWGKNAGCDFAKKKCLLPPLTNPTINSPINHWCKTSGEMKCTGDRKAIGWCNFGVISGGIKKDGVSAPQFRYFDSGGSPDPNRGGLLETADYCPFYMEVDLTDANSVVIGSTDCLNSDNQPSTTQQVFGQKYGSSSRCFESSLHIPGITVDEPEGKCFKFECLAWENGTVKGVAVSIDGGLLGSINDRTINCYIGEGGTEKTVFGWLGSFICPKIPTICEGKLGNEYRDPPKWWETFFQDMIEWITTNWVLTAILGVVLILGLIFLFGICTCCFCFCKKMFKPKKRYRRSRRRPTGRKHRRVHPV